MPRAEPGPPDAVVLRALAERLATDAGRLALDGRRSAAALGASTKSSATDLVTEFDRAAERLIVDALAAERPLDAIVGEEGTDRPGQSGVAWLIDPIDGTTNFVYDLPAWSCSVAATYRGSTLAGAVYIPPLDELFSAHLGGVATCNAAPIAAADTSELRLALVATGFSYQPERRRQQAELVARLIGDVRDIRRLGSAAIDLCFVAAGRVDAYYERHLNAWDAAAGELIARQAGAITSDFTGGPAGAAAMLAAAPGIHAALLDRLRSG